MTEERVKQALEQAVAAATASLDGMSITMPIRAWIDLVWAIRYGSAVRPLSEYEDINEEAENV